MKIELDIQNNNQKRPPPQEKLRGAGFFISKPSNVEDATYPLSDF